MNNILKTQVLIIGSGPGGYSSAFRCLDLNLKTILIESHENNIGGVCLNVGCIPSKTLLYIAKIIKKNQFLKHQGIISNSENTDLNIEKVRVWKEKIVNKISTNLKKLIKARNLNIIYGYAQFISKNSALITKCNKEKIIINFDSAIIASGSYPNRISFLNKENPFIWDSTDALKLNKIPNNLLIIGGGIIGLEMAYIYHALGSKIDILEISDTIIPQVDQDVLKIFLKNMYSVFNLYLNTTLKSVEIKNKKIFVSMENKKQNWADSKYYDAVIISVGRTPNTKLLNLEKIGVLVDSSNFIEVDQQMKTSVPNIYAIGDVVGPPMLAHKSTYQGKLVAEIIYGKKYFFDTNIIPSIVYTDPELAWVGITEQEAKKRNITYKSSLVPWIALGQAVSSHSHNGMTKLIFNKKNNKIIGGSVVGTNGSELLGEISLAIEMGCESSDIFLTIHAHPTLYESISLASEIYEGVATDFINF